jgi:hypothetical protein
MTTATSASFSFLTHTWGTGSPLLLWERDRVRGHAVEQCHSEYTPHPDSFDWAQDRLPPQGGKEPKPSLV